MEEVNRMADELDHMNKNLLKLKVKNKADESAEDTEVIAPITEEDEKEVNKSLNTCPVKGFKLSRGTATYKFSHKSQLKSVPIKHSNTSTTPMFPWV